MESAAAQFGSFALVLIVLIGGIRWLAGQYEKIQKEALEHRAEMALECKAERTAAEARHEQSRTAHMQRIEGLEGKIEVALAIQLERNGEILQVTSAALERFTAVIAAHNSHTNSLRL